MKGNGFIRLMMSWGLLLLHVIIFTATVDAIPLHSSASKLEAVGIGSAFFDSPQAVEKNFNQAFAASSLLSFGSSLRFAVFKNAIEQQNSPGHRMVLNIMKQNPNYCEICETAMTAIVDGITMNGCTSTAANDAMNAVCTALMPTGSAMCGEILEAECQNLATQIQEGKVTPQTMCASICQQDLILHNSN